MRSPPVGGDPLDLHAVLADLTDRKVERLMVEGGGTVHTQFLTAGRYLPPVLGLPDLVVTKVGAADSRLVASGVVLAVEIILPGSRNVDLRLRPVEYAQGVPHYWIVDLDPPVPLITVFHLTVPG